MNEASKRMKGLKSRQRIFGVLFVLSLAWLCYGMVATSNAVDDVTSEQVEADEFNSAETRQAARDLGAGIGASISLAFFFCTGLPFLLLFGLLAWRNGAGHATERRHLETLAQGRQE